MSDKRIVLLALDGSEHCERALNWYLDRCKRDEDELIGYHCWQHQHLSTFSLSTPFQLPVGEWEKVMKRAVEEVRSIEDAFTAKCQARKIKYKFYDENESKPGEGIIRAAKEHHVDLIVMGTRGLSSLRRTVLGSVSDYVLHHTHTPIAVVPSPEA